MQVTKPQSFDHQFRAFLQTFFALQAPVKYIFSQSIDFENIKSVVHKKKFVIWSDRMVKIPNPHHLKRKQKIVTLNPNLVGFKDHNTVSETKSISGVTRIKLGRNVDC